MSLPINKIVIGSKVICPDGTTGRLIFIESDWLAYVRVGDAVRIGNIKDLREIEEQLRLWD